ncbi:hypothetical protein L1887_16363 [Cichorium endivia]|nr:hypothetical protein L1887_16363 [Cichorium endivia]
MMKWRLWPSLLSRNFAVKLVVKKMEGANYDPVSVTGVKNKVPLIGKGYLNLAEFASFANEKEFELKIPLVVSYGSTEPHPSLHVSLGLMEILKEYVSIKKGKNASGEDDNGISESRSDEGDSSNPVDLNLLVDSGDGESFEDATVRKSFSYGTLAYARMKVNRVIVCYWQEHFTCLL